MSGRYTAIARPAGQTMTAYLVEAEGAQRRAGLLVLQEIFGINANMRSTAEAFAKWGYDVIVPDLFWRQEPRVELDPGSAADRERAMGLMKGLDQTQAVEDSLAAAAYLTGLDRSNGKAGAVGYCMGGKLAFLLATRAEIAAAVSYYAVAIDSVLGRAEDIRCPLLLHIAMEDALCNPDAQRRLHYALGSRPHVQIVDHPGVGHAFARRGGTTFNQHAAEAADTATAAFLARHLSGAR